MMVVRRYKLLVLSIRDEMYMMTIVKTALMLYLKVTKTINLVLITGKKKKITNIYTSKSIHLSLQNLLISINRVRYQLPWKHACSVMYNSL